MGYRHLPQQQLSKASSEPLLRLGKGCFSSEHSSVVLVLADVLGLHHPEPPRQVVTRIDASTSFDQNSLDFNGLSPSQASHRYCMENHLLFSHMESSTQSNTQSSGAKKLCFETKRFLSPEPTPRHVAKEQTLDLCNLLLQIQCEPWVLFTFLIYFRTRAD